MSRIPRNIGGQELVKLLGKFGYIVIRQTGSHIRLTSELKGKVHVITIPDRNPVKIGTLNNILNDISAYLGIDKKKLVKELFG